MTDENMFCFQCEQTAGCTACTGAAGVCGKTADVARLQDELTGALIALARAENGGKGDSESDGLMLEGMFACVSNVSFDPEAIAALERRVRAKAIALGEFDLYDMGELWDAQEDIRSLKSLLLFGMRGVAAYAYHAQALGKSDPAVTAFLYEGMRAVGSDLGMDELLPLVLKCGEVNLAAMAALEDANISAYGKPEPATGELKVEAGPFIVVTGHDLHDLKQLLEQTEGRGVNVYTHGEMLPANAYPELRKYPHLKGNYGTAWHNQRKEFKDLPAPILWTTNCLLKPDESYADRVFTTGPVSFPGAHVVETGEDGTKDFSALIDKALELGGWAADRTFAGINGGTSVTTGFGYDTVMSVAPAVIDAVNSGDIKRFILLAGRHAQGAQLLHRLRQDGAVRLRYPDPCLRQVPLQRPGPGQHRRHSSSAGRRPVQRRLRRDQDRACVGGCFRLRRERPAAFHGALLVRAEGGVHLAHAAALGHQGYLLGSYASGVREPWRATGAGGQLRCPPHIHPRGRPCPDHGLAGRSFPFGRDSSKGWAATCVAAFVPASKIALVVCAAAQLLASWAAVVA